MSKIRLNKEVDLTYVEFVEQFAHAFKTVPPKEKDKVMRKEFKKLTGKDPERSEGQVKRYKKGGSKGSD